MLHFPVFGQGSVMSISYGFVDRNISDVSLGLSYDKKISLKQSVGIGLTYGRYRDDFRGKWINTFDRSPVLGRYSSFASATRIVPYFEGIEEGGKIIPAYYVHAYELLAYYGRQLALGKKYHFFSSLGIGARLESSQQIHFVGEYQVLDGPLASTEYINILLIEKQTWVRPTCAVTFGFQYTLSQRTSIMLSHRLSLTIDHWYPLNQTFATLSVQI